MLFVFVIVGVYCWGMWSRCFVFIDEVNLIFVLIFVIFVSGFFIEGWWIVVDDDFWGRWLFVGFVVGKVLLFLVSKDIL